MKWILSLLTLFISITSTAQVDNTSYVNQSGEKVLQLSIVVPLDVKHAWEYFSTESKLAEWIAPVVQIELKSGGYILTNYDKTKSISDSSSIKLGIVSYLENELIILKVNLNNNFPKRLQTEDQNLQEIIQFIPIGTGRTKIISSMVGWGKGKDWEKAYDFFLRGNEWTYKELFKIVK